MIKKLLKVGLLLFLIGGAIAYWGYSKVFVSNTAFQEDSKELTVPSNISFDNFTTLLVDQKIIKDKSSFEYVSTLMKYKPTALQGGKYKIKKGWNNKQIIGTFRSRNQSPIKLTFNNVRDLHQLAGKLTQDIELDSVSLDKLLHSTDILSMTGAQSSADVMSYFIPNTYQVYWNIKANDLINRLKKEREKFWNINNRMAKLEELNMTKEEVYTLASIVEKESQYAPERPIIAGLYLNRLKRDMALQADPTVVYAVGDFSIRRVLNKHLAYDSPYNTYLYKGLPPGPIYMPSINSIDAVLNYKQHDYLFMCAKPGYGTQHAFAKTARGHTNNANKYRAWLNDQGIK